MALSRCWSTPCIPAATRYDAHFARVRNRNRNGLGLIHLFCFGFYSTSKARKKRKVEGRNCVGSAKRKGQRWTLITGYILIVQRTLACPWCSVGSASCHKATRSLFIVLAKIREKKRGEIRRRVSAYQSQDQDNQTSTSAKFLKGGSPDRVEAGWGSCTPPR